MTGDDGSLGRAFRHSRLKRLFESVRPISRPIPSPIARQSSDASTGTEPIRLGLCRRWDRSGRGRAVNQIFQTLAIARNTSRLLTLIDAIGIYTRHSFLYGWLTTEPEPDVIVIDLRETYTVGPIISLLDRCIEPIDRGIRTASTTSIAATTAEYLRRAPVQAVSLVIVAALLTNIAVTVMWDSLGSTDIGIRLIILGIALVGTRIEMTWPGLVESRTGRLVIAALEPPDIEDGPSEDR